MTLAESRGSLAFWRGSIDSMADSGWRSCVVAAAVAALMALPAAASATAPWSGSFGPVPDAAARPALPPQSQLASIPYAGGFERQVAPHAADGSRSA